MKTIKILTLLFTIMIIAQSCRKDSDDFTVTPPIIEPTTSISVVGSVLGTVIDESGTAIDGATVTFESKSTLTDKNGVFQFNDESLYATGTYIKVTKDGYFDGSRTFYASAGKTSIVALELIPLNEIAEFNSVTGSKITFEEVELDFKANSIVTQDGLPYSGNVNVAAKYLDPTNLNTLNQMPGDLTGVSSEQKRVVLTSMAMITVELTDDNGNELEVQDGKVVDAKIPVPQSLQSDAPATIPMWHFDEEAGIWIEEGSANLVNGVYETSLAHFSFWNCDIPNDFIFLKGSVLNRNIPIQGINVVIKAGSGPSGSGVSDQEGFFCGFVPNGIDLTIEIFNQCGDLIYSATVPASEIDINLDPINLNLFLNSVTISGNVTLCDGTPSPQTYINVSQGSLNNIIPVNNDLTFSGNIFYCNSDSELTLGAIDPTNSLASPTSSYSITGSIDAGEIQLCNEIIIPNIYQQFGDIIKSMTFENGQNANDSAYIIYVILNDNPEDLDSLVVTFNDYWVNGDLQTIFLNYIEGQPNQPIVIAMSVYGFLARGEASIKKVSQGGKEFMIINASLTDFEIKDSLLFDESYEVLDYHLTYEIL